MYQLSSNLSILIIMERKIKYKKGYHYQIVENYVAQTSIIPKTIIDTDFYSIDINGVLIAKKGYAFDGPSGPTIDTKNFMRGSLIHDILYQAIREGLLDSMWRRQADKELRKACLEDGMNRLRAWYVYHAVSKFAGFAASPKNKKKILTAP